MALNTKYYDFIWSSTLFSSPKWNLYIVSLSHSVLTILFYGVNYRFVSMLMLFYIICFLFSQSRHIVLDIHLKRIMIGIEKYHDPTNRSLTEQHKHKLTKIYGNREQLYIKIAFTYKNVITILYSSLYRQYH